MPLAAQTIIDELVAIEFPGDPQAAANAWFRAWWKYASGMIHLADPNSGEAVARGVFVPALMPGFVQQSTALTFFSCLEQAMRGAWAALGTPASLKQDPPLAPVPLSYQRLNIIPASAPFVPMALPVVGIGLSARTQKNPPRQYLGTQIHAWTMTHTVTALLWIINPAVPPVPPIIPAPAPVILPFG